MGFTTKSKKQNPDLPREWNELANTELNKKQMN